MPYTNYHPVYLDLNARHVLIVGGGAIALEKLDSLLPNSGARITVISPETRAEIRNWHTEGKLTWIQREFQDEDVEPAYMVIAATDDPDLNARVYRCGNERHRLTNSVDDPANCNFIMSAITRRGPMQVAVSSAGASPALAQRVRNRVMSEILTDELGQLAEFLGDRRSEVKSRLPGYKVRQAFWERVIDSDIPELLTKDEPQADARFQTMLAAAVDHAPGDFDARVGKVYLVGAGPGDPELITLKAIRALQRADVVLYDRLVNPQLLDHAPAKAERIYAGKEVGHQSTAMPCSRRLQPPRQIMGTHEDFAKADSLPIDPSPHPSANGAPHTSLGQRPRADAASTEGQRPDPSENKTGRQHWINDQMIQHAQNGKIVVRLKGGDPFVFGRGGEEALALHAAGVPFEIVPGVSSAIAGPAAAGIPVTHRGTSTAFGVFAGQEAPGKDDVPWDIAAKMPTALFLMGVDRLPYIAERLIQEGRDPQTPAAVISRATLPDQIVVTGTLKDIAERASGVPAPAVIVIGDVVSVRQSLTDTVQNHRPEDRDNDVQFDRSLGEREKICA